MSTRRSSSRRAAAAAVSAIKKASESDDISSNAKPTSSRKRGLRIPKTASSAKNAKLNEEKEASQSEYFQTEVESVGIGTKLPRSFYDQDSVSLAKALLGKVLCRKLPETGEIVKGTIVETEAYPGCGDAASHSFKGVPTKSSMAMFMEPGTAYVYFTYGMYHCFNISSKDNGGACLLRAVELLEDYEIMQMLRRPQKKKAETPTPEAKKKDVKRLKPHELTNGPAKLCLAFNIDRFICDKIDMTSSNELWLENSFNEFYNLRQFEINESRRVGIDSTPPEARNKLYRFFVKDNASVSKAKFSDDKVSRSTPTKKSKR
ncbi:unnamed protein product [Orchesella dallaii]|uniref:DNA-3-methyladenine glycosylase II n=1 Tax=Orchesella dallaii TaxID=48710 RepID=A0ABP1QF41_9HEXA